MFAARVGIIRLAVFRFSEAYIVNDKHFKGFHFLLFGFVLSMLLLIFSPNLISAIVGWDGLGLRSYLLVIYYSSTKAYNSGIVTALRNRVGDVLILLGIGALVYEGEWNTYFYRRLSLPGEIIILIIVARTTKSAQIPFSAWLPAAIAAPTPVSSLVHSSTLVTAGVYLLIRHYDLLWDSGLRIYLLWIGRLTMTLARVRALYEIDIKKIVALSTLSQLGIMILSLGAGLYWLRFFHLLAHAFFKALLFVATGNLIHRRLDYQDLRRMGNSISRIPLSSSIVILANFSLCGLPFMSAFFSKEMILEYLLLGNYPVYGYMLIFLGVLLTRAYRSRFIFLVFLTKSRGFRFMHQFDRDFKIIQSMLLLIAPAVAGGFILHELIFSATVLSASSLALKMSVLGGLLFGLGVGGLLRKTRMKLNFNKCLWRLGNMWALPFITSTAFSSFFLRKGYAYVTLVDRGSHRFLVLGYVDKRINVGNWFSSNQPYFIPMMLVIFLWTFTTITILFYLCNYKL